MFNIGDRVKVFRSNTISNWIGSTGVIVQIENSEQYPYRVEFDAGDKNAIQGNNSFSPDELELLDPNPCLVTADANGEIELPNWVKPGNYRRTDNPDGSILLEPLMTRAEWEATK